MIIVTLLPLHYSSREGRNHFLFHGSGIREVSLSWDWNFFHFAFGFDISSKHLRSDCVGIPRKHKIRGEPALCVMRRVDNAKNERKIVITSLLILLFLISSLVPYFITVILEANCLACHGQKWLFVLKESSVVFLLFNSLANPCLTTFRVNELKDSVKGGCFHRR